MKTMANGIFAALLMLSPAMAEEGSNAPGVASMQCSAEGLQDFVGHSLKDYSDDELKDLAQSKTLRVGKPGTAFTMDLREDRVNVIVDGDEVITRIYCG